MKTMSELGRQSVRYDVQIAAREFIALCIAIAYRKKIYGARERALETLLPRALGIFRNPMDVYAMKPSEIFYQPAAVAAGSNQH